MALRLKANRRFPSIPVVTDDPKNHTQVLMVIKEAMEIGQRRTTDLLNSYIRVQDLIDLGLITIEGNTNSIVGADLSEIADIGDLSGAATGDFLRFDGSEWVNDQLAPGDITQAMVTQHQAALSIAYGQITGAPSIPNDISSATFITTDDETATLANSLKLMAGSNVTFDTSTPGELKISASGGGGTVSPLTTKGDLYTHDGSANTRLPVGTNSQVLTADATATTGQRWKTRYFLEPVANGDSDDPEMVFSDGDIVTVPVELE